MLIKVTFKSGSIKIQIDYFLIRVDSRRLYADCKVITSMYLGTPHRLLVLDMELKCSKWKKRSVGEPTVKLWNLTRKNAMKLVEGITKEGAWRQVEDANTMWEAMATFKGRLRKSLVYLEEVASK